MIHFILDTRTRIYATNALMYVRYRKTILKESLCNMSQMHQIRTHHWSVVLAIGLFGYS